MSKQSWEYCRIAELIDVPTAAIKAVLIFLGLHANDNGVSFYGYEVMGERLKLSRSSVWRSIKYLSQLGILSWEKGTGGVGYKQTNQYQLDLESMKHLLINQGLYDVHSLKRILPIDKSSSFTGKLDEDSVMTEIVAGAGFTVKLDNQDLVSEGNSITGVECHTETIRVSPCNTSTQGVLPLNQYTVKSSTQDASAISSLGLFINSPYEVLRHDNHDEAVQTASKVFAAPVSPNESYFKSIDEVPCDQSKSNCKPELHLLMAEATANEQGGNCKWHPEQVQIEEGATANERGATANLICV
jgi:hypothetical protein